MKYSLNPGIPPSVFLFFSVSAGIVLGRQLPPGFQTRLLLGVCLLIAASGSVLLLQKPLPVLAGLILLFWGVFSIQATLYPEIDPGHIAYYTSRGKIRITGRVKNFSRQYPNRVKFILACNQVQENGRDCRPVKGNIRITLYGKKNFPKYGDLISFQSTPRPVRNFSNPGGFDYTVFMKLKKVYCLAYANVKDIRVSGPSAPRNPLQKLLRGIEDLRNRSHGLILSSSYGNGTEKSIMTSLLTGKKEVLSHDTRDLLSKAGISHILAVSGLHLSIIGFLFFWLSYRFFSFFPTLLIRGRSKKIAFVLAMVPITGYAVFAGFSPSTQRAYIMTAVFLCSFLFEKEPDLLSSVSVAGVIILILDGGALYSVSFQLSFAAVFFIIRGFQLIPRNRMPANKIFSYFLSMILVTFFAGMATFPLTAHYFHTSSHVQPVSNLIAVPLIGFLALPMGFLAIFLYIPFPGVSTLMLGLCCKLVSCVLSLCRFLTDLPFAWNRVADFSLVEICLFYLCAVFAFCMVQTRGRKRMIWGCLSAAVLSACLAAAWYPAFSRQVPGNLKITVLDVGQGNAALIRTPDYQTVLVDGGGFSDSSVFDTGRFILAPFLWKNHIKELDYVVLTHPDADHLNGLVFILKNFKVSALIKNTDQAVSGNYRALIETCREKQIRILHPGDDKDNILNIGQTALTFFQAPVRGSGSNFNNNSIVFKITYKNFSMLFPGDILKQREFSLVNVYGTRLQSDFLLSPHHGSLSSSSKFFLDQINPKSVIISCGWRNRYGFPHAKVLERYQNLDIAILRTDNNGAVIIESDGRDHQTRTAKGG